MADFGIYDVMYHFLKAKGRGKIAVYKHSFCYLTLSKCVVGCARNASDTWSRPRKVSRECSRTTTETNLQRNTLHLPFSLKISRRLALCVCIDAFLNVLLPAYLGYREPPLLNLREVQT